MMISTCGECGKTNTPTYEVIQGEKKECVCPACADKLGLLSGVKDMDDVFEGPSNGNRPPPGMYPQNWRL